MLRISSRNADRHGGADDQPRQPQQRHQQAQHDGQREGVADSVRVLPSPIDDLAQLEPVVGEGIEILRNAVPLPVVAHRLRADIGAIDDARHDARVERCTDEGDGARRSRCHGWRPAATRGPRGRMVARDAHSVLQDLVKEQRGSGRCRGW